MPKAKREVTNAQLADTQQTILTRLDDQDRAIFNKDGASRITRLESAMFDKDGKNRLENIETLITSSKMIGSIIAWLAAVAVPLTSVITWWKTTGVSK